MSESLKLAKDYIGKNVRVEVDRPLGSKHPEYDYEYLVNYGFVPGTKAPDGEELDAYILGIGKPLQSFEGKCIAVVHRKDDDDDKLVVVAEDSEGITDEAIIGQVHFQESWFNSVIVR